MQTSTNFGATGQTSFYGAADDSPESFWARAVRDYTACNLTNCLDRMAAIWGIAKLVRDQMQLNIPGEEYGIGLWKSNLLAQLAWRVVDSKRTKRYENLDKIYPSWSWASLMGEIEIADRNAYLDGNTYYRATNHEGGQVCFEVTTQQGDDFQPKLQRNEIAIKGKLIEARISASTDLDAHYDLEIGRSVSRGGSQKTSSSTVSRHFEMYHDTIDWVVEVQTGCFLMILAASRSEQGRGQEESCHSADLIDGIGLILKERPLNKKDQLFYRRMGTFRFRGIEKSVYDGLCGDAEADFWLA